MRLLRAFLVSLGILYETLGQQGMFLERYREQIQSYIMTGHAGGWHNCDIMTADSFSTEDTPQIAMNLDKLNTMNIKSAFSSSHCVLVNYNVRDFTELQTLINFGWAASDHVRIALVVKMTSGTNLGMVTNTTKLPFLIAAEVGQAKEQFLCPVVGEIDPRLDNVMCKLTYVSYKNKTLRILQFGLRPYFVMTSNGFFDGVNIRLMNVLMDKLDFMPKIIVPNSYLDGDNRV